MTGNADERHLLAKKFLTMSDDELLCELNKAFGFSDGDVTSEGVYSWEGDGPYQKLEDLKEWLQSLNEHVWKSICECYRRLIPLKSTDKTILFLLDSAQVIIRYYGGSLSEGLSVSTSIFRSSMDVVSTYCSE